MTSTLSTTAQIAQRAAQLVCDQQQTSTPKICQQAALELDLAKKELPASVADLNNAAADYRKLFSPSYDHDLLSLRKKALALLGFFQSFQIYLTGSVLKGSANKHSDLNLLVYSDDPKAIEIFLLNQQIDYSCRAKKTQFRQTDSPAIAFWFDNTQVHLQVLPNIAQHQNHKKNDRANYQQLKELIANNQNDQSVAV